MSFETPLERRSETEVVAGWLVQLIRRDPDLCAAVKAALDEIEVVNENLRAAEPPPPRKPQSVAQVLRSSGVELETLTREFIENRRIDEIRRLIEGLSSTDLLYRAVCAEMFAQYKISYPELVEKANATSPPLGGVA